MYIRTAIVVVSERRGMATVGSPINISDDRHSAQANGCDGSGLWKEAGKLANRSRMPAPKCRAQSQLKCGIKRAVWRTMVYKCGGATFFLLHVIDLNLKLNYVCAYASENAC